MSENSRYEGRDLEAMSLAPNYHAWILREIAPHIGKRIAEIGAGSGTFSSLLSQLPIEELLTVEPSNEMYPLLTRRFIGNNRVQCMQAFFSDVSEQYRGHFDTVLYINVLEHIKDDEGELRHAKDALKNGGSICIFVPALKWLYGEHDRSVGHLRRYHKKQLKELLEQTGFEIATLKYFDMAGILPWLLFMRLMHGKVNSQSAGTYDSFIVPIMSRIESIVAPFVGKNLIAVARKKS